MGLCLVCGKRTSFLSRVTLREGEELCGRQCHKSWNEREAAKSIGAVAIALGEAQRQRLLKLLEEAGRDASRVLDVARRAAAHRFYDISAEACFKALEQSGSDVDGILQCARQAAALARGAEESDVGPADKFYEVAANGYLRAIALDIDNPRDSAYAKWEYADVLWRTRDPRGIDGPMKLTKYAARIGTPTLDRAFERRTPGRSSMPSEAFDDVRHYLSEAEKELRRHVRSAPEDLEAFRLLHKIAVLLDRPATAVEEQVKRLEIRQSLLKQGPAPPSAVDRTGASFENNCLQVVRAMGFRAELTEATSDGGIDIIAFQDQPLVRGKYIIQCKDWTNPVGEPVLRDLLGVVAAEDAVKGVLITSSTFTDAAKRFAEGKRLELIDGRDLKDLTAQSQRQT